MTHAEALQLPPCHECGGGTAYRTVAGLLCCGECERFEHVEPEGTVAKPEPLRFSLGSALLAARAAGRL